MILCVLKEVVKQWLSRCLDKKYYKGYDEDFYIEANEILNEVEKIVWDYINGNRDKY